MATVFFLQNLIVCVAQAASFGFPFLFEKAGALHALTAAAFEKFTIANRKTKFFNDVGRAVCCMMQCGMIPHSENHHDAGSVHHPFLLVQWELQLTSLEGLKLLSNFMQQQEHHSIDVHPMTTPP